MYDRLQPLGAFPILVGMLLAGQGNEGCSNHRRQARLQPNADLLQPSVRSGWNLRDAPDAVAAARRFVGLSPDVAASAKIVTVQNDDTPFLADKLNGRELWLVTIPDWSIEFKSAPEDKDSYQRTLDILLDPATGQVLKVRTRWPKDLPGRPIELDAKSAEDRIGSDRYHGFASETPGMSFLDALETVPYLALKAKQVQGLWVLWSHMDSKPRPMWVIELWGLPPFRFHGGDYPSNAEDYVRLVVDPETKAWVAKEHLLTYPPLDVEKARAERTPDQP